ncbi:paladin-like [Quillaja saponaria]|uniref:Paladin-like n=1 Tax=Quillaja saponaria TaxID=32244 RepID=A0AAD7Q1J4_QUISA|nr:paladin-like [Quillaja saponaria]
MKLRGGSVLGKKTILKSDHFPGCQNKRLTPQIDGAPNYRQVVDINGRPFVLRDVERPFSNLEYTGCNPLLFQLRDQADQL